MPDGQPDSMSDMLQCVKDAEAAKRLSDAELPALRQDVARLLQICPWLRTEVTIDLPMHWPTALKNEWLVESIYDERRFVARAFNRILRSVGLPITYEWVVHRYEDSCAGTDYGSSEQLLASPLLPAHLAAHLRLVVSSGGDEVESLLERIHGAVTRRNSVVDDL